MKNVCIMTSQIKRMSANDYSNLKDVWPLVGMSLQSALTELARRKPLQVRVSVTRTDFLHKGWSGAFELERDNRAFVR